MTFKELLKGKRNFTLGFIGGSITEGTSGHCFIDTVKEELTKKYPGNEFTFINAGVGGTDSTLGLFRLERDVLTHEPDIVFIEYAVNDGGNKSSGIYVENMIRKIKAFNKDTEVVLLYAATAHMIQEYNDGRIPQSVAQHMKLSEYYDIFQINLGCILNEIALKNNMKFSDYLADGCHPTKEGYENYGKIITEELEKAEFCKKDILGMDFLYGRKIENPRLVLAKEFENKQWKLSYNDLHKRLPNYIYSFEEGDEFSFEFKGSILGIYHAIEKDSGIFEYSIDGGDWIEFSTWDEYALRFNRACSCLLTDSLEDKLHSIKIRNPKKKDEKSEGYYIRIGAFLIG